MRKILFALFIITRIYAQELNFHGQFQQASIIKVTGDKIESATFDNRELNVHDNKYFIVAFDRDDSSEVELKVRFIDGKEIVKKIKPQKRKFNIQRINNMKPALVEHPEKENERILKERQISQEARTKIGENKIPMYLEKIIRPVKGGRISSQFGNQRILNGEPKNFHNGIDIALPEGSPVYAMADGIILLAVDTFYYAGTNILIDHGDGLNSFYLHLKKLFVENGDTVKVGQKIGEVGSTGRSTGPHLHWGVQWYNKRIDPIVVLENFSNKNKNRKSKSR